MACCKCKKVTICQSCAMPLKNKEDYGTKSDGSKSCEYCHYCFSNGKFTDPELTQEQMIKKVETIMQEMKMSEKQIDEVKAVIPFLKRWG